MAGMNGGLDHCAHCGAPGTTHAEGCPMAIKPAVDPAQLPTLAIRQTLNWGASPEGDEAVIIVAGVSGQQVKLHFTIESLADLYVSARQALNQMRLNSRARGDEVTAATPVANVAVGHISGIKGVVLKFDPDTPNESTYVLPIEIASSAAKLLAIEAGKRMRIEAGLAMPGRKVIRPN